MTLFGRDNAMGHIQTEQEYKQPASSTRIFKYSFLQKISLEIFLNLSLKFSGHKNFRVNEDVRNMAE